MSGNQFLLPDELGWKCNDELKKTVSDWLTKVARIQEKRQFKSGPDFLLLMDVAIAELSDEMYAVIKKYQEKR